MENLFSEVESLNATFGINLEALHYAFSIAKNNNKLTVLRAGPPVSQNERSSHFLGEILKLTDYFIAQEWEARYYLDMFNNESIEEMSAELLNGGAKNVCVTDGATYGYFLSKDGFSCSFNRFPLDLVDISGSTDAFCAALSASLGSAYSQEDSLRIAWATGNATSNRIGIINSLPSVFEVQTILNTHFNYNVFSNVSNNSKKNTGTS
jgi:sugar/nucleoside kinase (ribokinase family)